MLTALGDHEKVQHQWHFWSDNSTKLDQPHGLKVRSKPEKIKHAINKKDKQLINKEEWLLTYIYKKE